MGRRFAQIAFTPQVKRNQEMHGSRRQYQRVEDFAEDGNILSSYDKEFIIERDGFTRHPSASPDGLTFSIEGPKGLSAHPQRQHHWICRSERQ
jgi:hypothetical protein